MTPHLIVVGAAVAVGCVAWSGAFLRRPARRRRSGASAHPRSLTAWREPRTLLIGVFVLAFAFAEGAGNDWISVALIDGYGAAPPSARSRSPSSSPP